ncbi:hypothetical protein [Pelosinus fermentans]|uniref:Uncharacterized protein n=1 Tax=Pelosinus fermentans JBW45 TaxID=1192197 RepID=I8TXZ6_9FIRM|nr:hypothetical protein [Pelosinus fermentans]AJQ26196.1 hypothetical protein JBW_00844 [Pelosinus fermentans JBW45]
MIHFRKMYHTRGIFIRLLMKGFVFFVDVIKNKNGKLAGESKTSTEKIHFSIQEIIGFVNKIAPTLEELARVIDYNQNVFMQASNKSKEEEMSIGKIHSALEAIKDMGGELNKDMKAMAYK